MHVNRALAIVLVLALGRESAVAQPRPPATPPSITAPRPEPAAPPVVPTASIPDSAVLVIQNRTIAVFRAAFGAMSAMERAAAASQRIRALIASDTGTVVATRVVPEGIVVTAQGVGVFTITQADVDTLAGESIAVAAARSAERLQTALGEAHEQSSFVHLARAIAAALVATILFIAVIRVIRWSRRRGAERMVTATAARIPDLRIRGFTIFSGESALALVRRFVDLLAWGAGLVATYLWLAFVLTRFAYSRPWGEALGDYLATTIGTLARSAIGAVPGIFTVILILIFTRWLARLVSSFFDAVEVGSVDVPWPHADTANPTKRIVLVLLWLFAIVVAYPYVPGSGSDAFKGISVFAGLVISLGSTGIVNQAMSGLVLMYSRALKPGDYVRVGEIEGTVIVLGMLSTKIRTNKREEVTLPNAVVVGASVKNFSRIDSQDGLLVSTSVTIGYDTPWRQVEGMLLMAAEETEGLQSHPPAFVLKTALNDFYIEYELDAVLSRPEDRRRVLDRLHANIVDAFNEYGVQIMSPHYEGDRARPAVVPQDRWYEAPARRRPAAGLRGPDGSGGDGAFQPARAGDQP